MHNSISEGKGVVKRETKTAVNYLSNLKIIHLTKKLNYQTFWVKLA